MWRTLILSLGLVLSSINSYSAQADCSVAPNEAIIKHTINASGIEFSVTPSDSGCPATKLSFAYVYLDQATNVWDKWTSWMVGSTTGKAFNFNVPAIKGKSRVTIGIEASNKWGTAAYTPYGVSFQTTGSESLTPLASTVIDAVISGQAFTFEISHPESAVCSNFIKSSNNLLRNYNCNIPISYRVTSKSSTSFYGNGKVYSETGADVGFFGSMTFLDSHDLAWKKSTIYASMPSNGSVTLSFTGAGNHHTYTVISRKPIQLRVKTAEEVVAEKAAADRAEKEKAAANAARERSIQDAKKLSITCIKGKSKKQVIGEKPVCPKGFTNPMDKYLTFKAFSECQLYKKDSPYGGAKLNDGGRTLVLDSISEYNDSLDRLNYKDFACVKKAVQLPAFLDSKIGITRAIDGLQTGKWGKSSAFWTYHPDNGLSISINSR